MSLITKQIEELRAYAKDRKGELAKLIADAWLKLFRENIENK